MAGEWTLHRLRSAIIRENSLLIVLRLLKEADLSEWETLDLLHLRYGATPTAKEFRRLCELMVSGGFATLELAGTTRKLRLTRAGVRLLARLEVEYRAIVSGVDSSSGVVLTR